MLSERQQFNFAAGPACLPNSVLLQVQKELVNYAGCGHSIMELSHRSKLFESIIERAKKNLSLLLGIPSNYRILFFQGGGTGQFAAIPMNLLKETRVLGDIVGSSVSSEDRGSADYLVTGAWSQKALEEARKYCLPNVVCNGANSRFTSIPPLEQWKFSSHPSYIYYCSNETIHGVEFPTVPQLPSHLSGVPLVADVSSNFLSRPFDISKHGLIFAGAQKNSGIAGLSVVIVREDLISEPRRETPTILDYKTFAENNSLFNTPPTFSIYVAGLVYEWLLSRGGLEAIGKINAEKSNKVYNRIRDSNGFYSCPVDPLYQSRMNIPIRIQNIALEPKFIKEAADHGLLELTGHRSVGGIRVSLYNAMPEEGVDALVDFMEAFETKHSSI